MEIAAACPTARELGLHAGTPLTKARILIPDLDIRDAEPEVDAAFLTRLALFAARRWTPRAALSGPDGLWLDLSGVTHLFGGERRMGERIVAFCARLGRSEEHPSELQSIMRNSYAACSLKKKKQPHQHP